MSLSLLLAGCSNSLDGHHVTDIQQLAVASDSALPGMNAASILLFSGTGTSPNDVAAIEAILKQNHLVYVRVNSEHLDAMHPSQMQAYRLLIVPGGNFVDMGNSLTADTTAKVHDAVTSGLNYLGICAGAFLAGSYPAPYKSFDLTAGVKFGFYAPEKNASLPGYQNSKYETRKAVVNITTAEGLALDQYWESGPRFTGWGDVVGKYPDGTPAIVEGSVGKVG